MKEPAMEDLESAIAAVARRFRPLEALVQPAFLGTENIPSSRPLLFVGNHTIYGVIDVPFLFLGLHRLKGIRLRALGDHIHFKVPVWRDFLNKHGVVPGTREACSALMENEQCVLVFPGGAREVAKRKGEAYRLKWGERLGFMRMALTHGCTVVPFSALGADDAYRIVLDGDEVMASPLGSLLSRLGVRSDTLMPVALGWGGTPIPKPERLYFHFSEALELSAYKGREDDDALCRELRTVVAGRVDAGIELLQRFRETDPKRTLRGRFLPW